MHEHKWILRKRQFISMVIWVKFCLIILFFTTDCESEYLRIIKEITSTMVIQNPV